MLLLQELYQLAPSESRLAQTVTSTCLSAYHDCASAQLRASENLDCSR
jgi:hypothetical protein